MKKKTLEFLEAHQSETPSTWREEAEWRRNNWSWLRHSQKIAVKVLLQMKQEGLTQKALAERMDCTQQYVSKILKGKENMSLDTLSKLEDALGISLIYDEQVAYPNMVAEEVFAQQGTSSTFLHPHHSVPALLIIVFHIAAHAVIFHVIL